jgi:hypothetical protein
MRSIQGPQNILELEGRHSFPLLVGGEGGYNDFVLSMFSSSYVEVAIVLNSVADMIQHFYCGLTRPYKLLVSGLKSGDAGV